MARHSKEIWSSKGVVLCLLVALISDVSFGYPGGAPNSDTVCEKLSPEHGVAPLTSASPFKVTLNRKEVNGGEGLTITLEAVGDGYYKGFLVAVKKEGDGKSPVGKFNIVDPDSQAIKCFGVANSTATHNSGESKQKTTLEWIAPNEDLSGLEVVYTFVQDWDKIWQDVKHPEKVTVKRDASFKEVAPVQAKLSAELLAKLREVYGECEDGAHGCMGIPNGCIRSFLDEKDSENPPTCSVMVSWNAKGDRNAYRITGNPENAKGYVAVGFSEDNKMGADSVVGCYGSDNGAVVNRFKNPDKYNLGHLESPLLGISSQKTATIDGHLFCDFDQTDHAMEGILDVKLRDTKYYILLAKGSSGSAAALGPHAFGGSEIGASGDKFDVTFSGIAAASSSSLVLYKLHGAFMIVAWLVCASTGMFTARYYKMTHTDFMPFNKAFWFAVHVFCMFSTVFLTVCGAVFISVKKGGWYPADGKWWHPILGVILFGLAAFQVLIAFLRPHPGTKFRPLFNWIHWLAGNSAHIVGIACIFLANELPAASLDRKEYLFVTLGAVLFHIVMHLVLSFHTLWADKQLGTNTKRAVTPAPMKPHAQQTEAPGTGFRTFMMSLYVVGLVGCAVALIIFICVPPEESDS